VEKLTSQPPWDELALTRLAAELRTSSIQPAVARDTDCNLSRRNKNKKPCVAIEARIPMITTAIKTSAKEKPSALTEDWRGEKRSKLHFVAFMDTTWKQ
jgi:hypothetical protein